MSNTDLKRNLEAAEYMFSPLAYRADSFLMLDVIFRSKDRNLQKWVHDLFALLLKTKGAA